MVQLFGLDIADDSPSDFTVGALQFSGWRRSANQLTTAIRCGTVNMLLRTALPIGPSSFKSFRLSDLLAPTQLTGVDAFLVEIGGMRLAGGGEPRAFDRAPAAFSIAGVGGWPQFTSHPIDIDPAGALLLDFSDPGNPLLSLLPGAFQLRATVLASASGNEKPFFARNYLSSGNTLELTRQQVSVDISFAVARDTPLPLYGERFGDDIALGMTLGACELHAVIARAGTRPNRVVRLWVGSGPGGAALTTYGLADAANEPGRWRVSGNSLDLSCRYGSKGRVATLMFAALLGEACEPGQLGGVTLVQDGDQPLHGPVPEGEFWLHGASAALVCDAREKAGVSTFPQAADDPLLACMLTELTLPWARFQDAAPSRPEFRYPRPGRSYLASTGGGRAVETLAFGGAGLGLPLLHGEWFGPADDARRKALEKPLAAFNDALNNHSRQLVHVPRKTTHETRFEEVPQAGTRLRPERVYELTRSPELARPDVSAFPAGLGFALARVAVRWKEGKPPDYILLQPGTNPLSDYQELERCLGDFRLSLPAAPAGRPFGLIKFSRERTLPDIWQSEPTLPRRVQELDLLHPSLKAAAWTGLLLFDLPVDCSEATEYPVLRSVVPPGLKLEYLAITPKREAGERAAVCGRIKWKTTKKLDPGQKEPQPGIPDNQLEVGSLAVSLDVAWYDGALTFFHSKTKLLFGSLLGRQSGAPKDFDIEGSFDAATRTLRFAGMFSEPRELLDRPFGPVESLKVKSAAIEHVDGKNSASLAGSIALGDFQAGDFDFGAGSPIDFRGLRIELPDTLKLEGDWLRISYPSLSIPLPLPAFDFQGFALRLDRLAVDWDLSARWQELFELHQGNLQGSSVALGFRVELMKLPELAFKNLDRLVLDLWLGFGKNGSSRIGFSFVDFSAKTGSIELDLLRFLVLRVAGVEKFRSQDGKAKGLTLKQVSLEVLEQKIVENLELIVFSAEKNRYGFLGFLPNVGTLGKDLIDVRWFLVAQNLSLRPDLVARVLEIDSADPAAPAGVCKSSQDLEERRQKIEAGIAQLAKDVREHAFEGQVTDVEEWTFAAGFEFLRLLEGKALFQDGRYYGLTLDGPIFCDWFGYNLALSVLYVKGRTPGEDEFSLTLRLPRVTLPAFEFIGGLVHFWMRMDGSFLMDIGFPWIEGGVRRWDRALGAIITPFQGSGGFYLRKQSVKGLETSGAHRGLQVGAGLALQFGLGGAYGGGIFTVSATIGIFVVVEGEALLCDDQLRGLRLIGSVGILGRATGELNWWVISIRVDILLIAEARLTFQWGQLQLPAAAESCEQKEGARISFEMVVYASVSASACIGWGPFKVCAGISVSIAIPISPKIELRSA